MTKSMKSKWVSIPALTGICLMSASAFGASATERQYLEEMKKMAERLEKVTSESQKMQKEMTALRAEMRELKRDAEKYRQANKTLAKSSAKSQDKSGDQDQSANGQTLARSDKDSMLSRFTRFPTVTTSPYMGLQSSYDGSDLVVNVSSMGEDLRLLRQKQALAKKMGGDLSVLDDRPVIVVSGKLEPTIWGRRVAGQRNSKSDIDLDSTELDFLVEGSSNVFGFISLAYDNKTLDSALVNSPVGRRVSNSNIYLKRGFVTVGNLDKFPLYLSAGQMYTDFGRYTSNMISSTMPSRIGRTNARQVHLGFASKSGLNLTGYVYKGDAHTYRQNKIDEGGVNLRYKTDIKSLKDGGLEIGAGYITDIADSERFQVTGSGERAVRGFAFTQEFLFNRVPAFNTYGELKAGLWKFVAEYVGAVRSFDFRNVSYNWQGAEPKAMQLELTRKFELFNKPSLVAFAYERSWQALALAMPKSSYSAVFSIFPLKNVRLSLEYRRAKEYAYGDSAYIVGNPAGLIPVQPFYSAGGYTNSVIAQLGLYF